MALRSATTTFLRVGLTLVLAGGAWVTATAVAPETAQAVVSCQYSGLTSTKVKNVSCARGAYGHLTRANSSPGNASAAGTRDGAWVGKGSWSTNTSGTCWQYPTMLWG